MPKVVSISKSVSQPKEVYDINVRDTHNFFTGGILVHNCEEAQNIGDYAVSQKILPMAGATGGKIIKSGTVRAVRNHFYRTFHEKDLGYVTITHRWQDCDNLLRGGFTDVIIDGKKERISTFVLSHMPLSIKHELYPNNPELWKSGDQDEADFRTQYGLEWIETFGLYLSMVEREKLSAGKHELEIQQAGMELLFAGIDFAGSDEEQADETAISVFRVTPMKDKEKVFGMTFKGDPVTQMNEIVNLLHPINGRFKPRKILADATGVGLFPVAQLKTLGLPIEGIMFGATDPEYREGGVSLNFKNSMLSYLKSELDNDRVHYAKSQQYPVPEMNIDHFKGLDQWWNLEVENTQRANKKISHPAGGHDDVVMADALAVFASKTEHAPSGKLNQLNQIRPQIAHSAYR